jgi:hypothetical protein
MSPGRMLSLGLLTAALSLLIAACDETGDPNDSEAESTPTPAATPTAAPADEPDEVAADIPCEVQGLEPPRDDVPETDPERVREWQETAMSFNDVTIGQDGRVYIGSHRHGSVLVLNEERELADVWTEGVRNTQPQIETHPDGRVLLLQDNGLNFYSPDGEHEKYISLTDPDAGFFPEYGGFGVDRDGHLYVGLGRNEGLIRIDENCQILGHWPDEDSAAPIMVTVDDAELTYAVTLGIGESWIEIRDSDGTLVDERHVDAPVQDGVPASVTGLPESGLALLWIVPEDPPDPDPQSRLVEDFVVQYFSTDGDLVQDWYASESGASKLLGAPRGMTIEDDGTVHIVDQGIGPDWMQMHTFDADGQFIEEWRLESDQELCGLIDDEARIGGC